MGVSIQCILNRKINGDPHMEGKSLAMAYCGDASGPDSAHPPTNTEDIISIVFDGGDKQPKIPDNPTEFQESLFAPIDRFITSDANPAWHDPMEGLDAVESILNKFRAGAKVELSPEFEFGGDDDEELTEGVRYDLESLKEILKNAQTAGAKFHLSFDV